jgi:TorA maturation chaperone TorD
MGRPTVETLRPSPADLALARATLYTTLAEGFLPPSRPGTKRLRAPVTAAAIEAAAVLVERAARTGEHESRPAVAEGAVAPDSPASVGLRAAVAHLIAAFELQDSLAPAYTRLFGHTARGEVPLYETEYGTGDPIQQPHELADLAGFLGAFGLMVDPERHERVDHVSCECEFLAFLALKEIWALEQGDRAILAETRKAAKLFLRDHLARFGPALGHRLARAEAAGMYGALGDALRAVVEADCRRLGVPCGPVLLRLRPTEDPAVPMACGDGGAPCAEAGCAVAGGDGGPQAEPTGRG